jgi:3-oxoacyl-[acyl-carrier protein] reductase
MSRHPASWCVPLPSIVVTGGTRGIGLGIARKLATAGHQVIAVARRSNKTFDAASEQSRRMGAGSLLFRAADLADIASLPALVKELRKEFGSVYGLINNAGIGTSGLLANMRDTQIEQLIRLNLLSPITLSKYVVRSMMADGDGRIVNIASIVAFTGFGGLAAYAASKAALVGFTRSLAREVGSLGITVNAVAPGFVETELTHGLTSAQREQIVRRSALRRLAEVEDVANSVAFLLGDGARNVTGTVMTVDAGGTA